MPLPEITAVKVLFYSHNDVHEREVPVSSEYGVALKINGSPYVSIACSGGEVELLAVGHLISEGIVLSMDEIEHVEFNEELLEADITLRDTDEILERLFRVRTIASGCGQGHAGGFTGPGKSGNPGGGVFIDPAGILLCMSKFLSSSEHHKLTRGVHSAALFDMAWKNLFFSDEIGRHNAVDKIIGYASVNGIPLKDKVIFSTGRLSSEIVMKGINSGIMGIFSKSSPTSLSVDIARKFDLLMIGNVSRSSFYIFSGRDKLKI